MQVYDDTTRQLAAYAVNLEYSSIPQSSREAVVRHLLDSIGCAYGALHSRPAVVARSIAATASSSFGASVFGLAGKTTPEYAAFANTTMIRHLDYNDTGIGGHPSDMIPAVLALGEALHAPGQKVIKAIYAAYETVAGVRRGGLYGVRLKKSHIDQLPAVLGSAVGAGIILDLEFDEMANAISLAITPNIPLRVVRTGELSDWKGSATAHGCMMGVFAARLAREGLTGPAKVFEGISGLNELVNIPEINLSDLGQPRNGLSAIESTCFKFYPAEFNAQGPIGTIIKLRDGLNIDDIELITNELHRDGWREIGGGQDDREEKWDPKTRETADHSLAYLMAVALVDGDITLDSFTAERISDPSLRPLMQKIEIITSREITEEHAGELPKWPSITRIEMKDGRKIEQHSGYPKGHPHNPLSDHELKQKFMDLCLRSMSEEQAVRLYETIMKLEELKDINNLTELFSLEVY